MFYLCSIILSFSLVLVGHFDWLFGGLSNVQINIDSVIALLNLPIVIINHDGLPNVKVKINLISLLSFLMLFLCLKKKKDKCYRGN